MSDCIIETFFATLNKTAMCQETKVFRKEIGVFRRFPWGTVARINSKHTEDQDINGVKMASINRVGSPMDVCEENYDLNQEVLDNKRKFLENKQRNRSRILLECI